MYLSEFTSTNETQTQKTAGEYRDRDVTRLVNHRPHTSLNETQPERNELHLHNCIFEKLIEKLITKKLIS